MLRVHESGSSSETCAYPNQVPNEGEGLRRDYVSTMDSSSILRDALSFAMADLLPERNKQIQALTPSTIWLRNTKCVTSAACNVTKGGSLTHDPHKGFTEGILLRWDTQLLLNQTCFCQILNQ